MQALKSDFKRIRALLLINLCATIVGLSLAASTADDPFARAGLICTVAIVFATSTLFFVFKRTSQLLGAQFGGLDQKVSSLTLANMRLHCNLGDKARESEYLAQASARFEELFHGVPFGCFTVDDLGKIFEWNTASSELFEVPSHIAIQRTVFDGFFDEVGANELARALEKAFTGEAMRNLELRTVSGERSKHLLRSEERRVGKECRL